MSVIRQQQTVYLEKCSFIAVILFYRIHSLQGILSFGLHAALGVPLKRAN
jgi:thiamine transporter ThiT